MIFSSLVFLYLFLPVVLLLYFLFPKALRNTFLLLASLLFYAWGEPKLVVLMLISILINYIMGLVIDRSSTKSRKKIWVAATIVANLAILSYYKYAAFAVGIIEDMFNVSIEWE